ncbi:hypothetical protein [Lacticaseibacillus suibinensis]|uniref:hypothetical protein n=1 Tax=Lacticaseibacillus suibinensis TaxID=2486011 RepID=UPI0013DE1909|nr:hypothetical protein [Lacticaseibacillus suibinensis]
MKIEELFFIAFSIVQSQTSKAGISGFINCDIEYDENYLHLLNAVCYFRPSFIPPFPSFRFYTSGEMFGE